MDNSIKGRIKRITPVEEVGSNGFQKREVHIVTEDQYPQTIAIQFDGSHINKPDQVKVDDLVTIGINIKGREWTNPQGEIKVFNVLQGWKISTDTTPANQTSAQQQPPIPAAQTFQPSADFNEKDHDDLPF